MTSNLQNLTVLGAGVLGGQIAWHSAYCGKQAVVYDINEEALERCRAALQHYAGIYQQDLGASPQQIEQTRSRLRYTTDLADAVATADLVIEAVPEIKILLDDPDESVREEAEKALDAIVPDAESSASP